MAEGRRKLISPDSAIKLAITTPAEITRFSRGFYQLDENILLVPVYPGGRFYSYLDSRQLSFDISDNGSLLSIQILISRDSWIKRADITLPQPSPAADIRFIDFRKHLPEAVIESSPDYNLIHIVFSPETKSKVYRITDAISFEVTSTSTLAGVWIDGVEDDRAARYQALWLKMMKDSRA